MVIQKNKKKLDDNIFVIFFEYLNSQFANRLSEVWHTLKNYIISFIQYFVIFKRGSQNESQIRILNLGRKKLQIYNKL